jgi:hypothetical protein
MNGLLRALLGGVHADASDSSFIDRQQIFSHGARDILKDDGGADRVHDRVVGDEGDIISSRDVGAENVVHLQQLAPAANLTNMLRWPQVRHAARRERAAVGVVSRTSGGGASINIASTGQHGINICISHFLII